MIHIATVHHKSADWIEIQRRYLDRFIQEPFRVYASLEGIAKEFHRFFDVVVPSRGPHAGKLNLLGAVILEHADPDDLIVFLDGDAFPIADPIHPLRELLEESALAAVCRSENEGDRQPHPCFCGVPARVWKDLPGDWSPGWCFRGMRTDTGANLLHRLEATDTRWAPIHRSNRRNLHPVLFGIYGGIVYHHGAGFRRIKTTKGDPGKLPIRPSRPARLADRVVRRLTRSRVDLAKRRARKRDENVAVRSVANMSLSAEVYEQIRSDPDFYRRFL